MNINIMNSKQDTNKYFELRRLLKTYSDLYKIYTFIFKYQYSFERDTYFKEFFYFNKSQEVYNDFSNITTTLNIQENKLIGYMRTKEDHYVDDSVNQALSCLVSLSNKNDSDSIIDVYMLQRDKNYQISKHSTNINYGQIFLSARI